MNESGQGFKHVTRGGLRFDQCPRFLEAVDIIADTRAGMQDAEEKRAKNKRGKRGR